MKKVEIVFGNDGSVTVEAFGFKGASCEEATEFLNKIFSRSNKKHKDSYYEEPEKIASSLHSGYCG